MAVVAEGHRMPGRKIGIGNRVQPPGLRRIAYVEQDAVALTGSCGESHRGVGRDVVALIRARPKPEQRVAPSRQQASDLVGAARRGVQIREDPGRAHDARILRRGERHLDHLDPEERGVGILLRGEIRASLQFLGGANGRRSRHVDVHVRVVSGVG